MSIQLPLIQVGISLPLLVLVAFSVLIRVGLFVVYEPVTYPDTGTYMSLARQLATADMSAYDGGRTPMYPILIVLGGQTLHGIYVIQSLLGIVSSILLFFTAIEVTHQRALAFCVGLIPTLILNQLFMEANILSEHLAGVLAVASLYVAVTMLMRGAGVTRAIMLGVLVAATVLTRPGYIMFVPLYGLVAILAVRKRRIVTGSLYLVAACLPIIGWMAVNAATVGQFGLSTRLGLGLMNHSGAFIEFADPRYAIIREVYLKHREIVVKSGEAQTHRGGEQYVTIFYALDDLKAATGMSEIQLSRELQKLSLDLFLRYPFRYAKSIFKAWLTYWTAPNYWRPEAINSPALVKVATAVWRIEHPLVRLANLALVLVMTALVVKIAMSATRGHFADMVSDRQLLVLLLAGTTVFGFSIFQALFEFSENGRYSIPTQQICVAFLILCVNWLIKRRQAVRSKVRLRTSRARLDTL